MGSVVKISKQLVSYNDCSNFRLDTHTCRLTNKPCYRDSDWKKCKLLEQKRGKCWCYDN